MIKLLENEVSLESSWLLNVKENDKTWNPEKKVWKKNEKDNVEENIYVCWHCGTIFKE